MTASQTRETDSIAEHIADALLEQGHEVVVEKPSLEKTLAGDEWDHVYVGLGPLHGLGTSSMYGALAVIGAHAAAGKCTLYVDDLDTGKIGSGLRVMRNNPARLIKPFYVYKREWEIAKIPENHDWLMSVVRYLLEVDKWPRLIVPAFGTDGFVTGGKITPQAAHASVAVDFSAYVPNASDAFKGEPGGPEADVWWATDSDPNAKPTKDLRPSWPVYQLGAGNFQDVVKSTGFLIPNAMWTGRFKQMVDLGKYVGCSWRFAYDALGEEFSYLLAEAESATARQRFAMARRQKDSFYKRMPDKKKIQELIVP